MILLQIPLLCLLYGDGWGDPLIPHVTAPGTWRLGVLESVVIRTPQQSEGFPVKVSLLSYPDKKTTFSSALLPLTPDNLFQGVVKLSITAEDSPGEFVYLMVESKVFREEARIPVSREAWTPMDEPDKSDLRRRRRQSDQSVLTEIQIQNMTEIYQPYPKLLNCCWKGHSHYLQHQNCELERNKGLKMQTKLYCYQSSVECCKYTEQHMYKRERVFMSSSIMELPQQLECTIYINDCNITIGAEISEDQQEPPTTVTITQSSADVSEQDGPNKRGYT
ncbi:uncharacterized protein RB166_019959 [Leptodactylus fuscus]|uniref:uncharacterized protein LOC142184758 n=1 Tax=Leptodactylus fuscus TaxID=238119 RepID=UPI003F4EE4F9